MLGPDVAGYLIISAFLFATGALGVLIRRSPLIVLLSLEIMLNGGEPRPDRVLAALRPRRRADLRAHRDGRRGLRGRRRARPDRRDGPPPARPRRRQALDPARLMTAAAWVCLFLPLGGGRADHAARQRRSRGARPAGSRRSRAAARSRPRSSPSVAMLGRAPEDRSRALDRLDVADGRRLPGRLLDPHRPALDDDDADRHRGRVADRRVLDRLHGRRRRGAPVLRVHVALRLLDADARPGREPADPARRLGPGRPLVVPADRLLAPPAAGGRRGQEGVHHERVRRRDDGARLLPADPEDGDARVRARVPRRRTGLSSTVAEPRSRSACSAARSRSRPSCRSRPGSRTRWRARRRSAP